MSRISRATSVWSLQCTCTPRACIIIVFSENALITRSAPKPRSITITRRFFCFDDKFKILCICFLFFSTDRPKSLHQIRRRRTDRKHSEFRRAYKHTRINSPKNFRYTFNEKCYFSQPTRVLRYVAGTHKSPAWMRIYIQNKKKRINRVQIF